jgi:NADPH2:quinone reductase
MRAAVLHEYGTPLCCEFAEPVASDDQVVVEVAAAGVNPFDVPLSSGTFFAKPAALPCVVGVDGVGRLPDGLVFNFESTVASFGAAGREPWSTEARSWSCPPGWTRRRELVPAEAVLVLGATGTVGSIAVQLAKLLDAGRIIAAGRDPDRLRRASELGADDCVRLGAADAGDRLAEAVGPGADLIIDLTWGPPAMLAVSAAATPRMPRAGRQRRRRGGSGAGGHRAQQSAGDPGVCEPPRAPRRAPWRLPASRRPCGVHTTAPVSLKRI